jgi:photosystem I subunit 10
MIASTTLFLSAARFGLAPTSNRNTTAGLKLVDSGNAVGLKSNDPSGEWSSGVS